MNIICDITNANQRLDRFCRKFFKSYEHITLKDIYHRLRKWLIKVNGKKLPENAILQIGDQIILHAIIEEHLVDKKDLKDSSMYVEHRLHRQNMSRESLILFEDEDRLVRNKPVGIVAHEGNKHTEDITMNQLLSSYMDRNIPIHAKSLKVNTVDTFRPAFAFRLDKDTSGVLVAAKTYPALQHINALIRDRQIGKEYIACVVWIPDFNVLAKNYNYSFTTTWWLEISEPLFKWFSSNTNRAHVFVNEEKWLESVTDVEILSSYKHEIIWPISLLKCTLHTGRMHQIRVHLAHIGHPILGDIQYWLPVINRLAHKNCWITRQLLHSYTYTFSSLEDKEIAVTAPPPQEFEKLFWDYDYTKIK